MSFRGRRTKLTTFQDVVDYMNDDQALRWLEVFQTGTNLHQDLKMKEALRANGIPVALKGVDLLMSLPPGSIAEHLKALPPAELQRFIEDMYGRMAERGHKRSAGPKQSPGDRGRVSPRSPSPRRRSASPPPAGQGRARSRSPAPRRRSPSPASGAPSFAPSSPSFAPSSPSFEPSSPRPRKLSEIEIFLKEVEAYAAQRHQLVDTDHYAPVAKFLAKCERSTVRDPEKRIIAMTFKWLTEPDATLTLSLVDGFVQASVA